MTENFGTRAQLALDAIHRQPARGIPSWALFAMEHSVIEHLAGAGTGDYLRRPEKTYLAMQRRAGTCFIDQYIPTNPLSMGAHGYESGTEHGATTGAETIVLDGMAIDSPEAVVEHMEQFVFPQLRAAIQGHTAEYAEEMCREIIRCETACQQEFGDDLLKVPHVQHFPNLRYGQYGYVNYFMAYALYPEVMEQDFALQADLALLRNGAVARAYCEAGLPPLCRLDHDMADGRGTLVDIRSLDRIWFPHFTRCLAPLLQAGIRLIWHCDGNLMAMLPRLLEAGLQGFQGFQYEHGMDYEAICRMKTRDGEGLLIVGGVSVTRTLPHGTPADVKRELQWLVEAGTKTGLFLGGSSSITPGVPLENILTLVEGLQYYQEKGRS